MEDKHTSLLIIGNSEHTNKTCKIEKFDLLSQVEEEYGKDSDLYQAYTTFKI